MTETIQLAKKQVIFLFIGVMAAAFLGVIAGSYFLRLKTVRAAKPGAGLLLKVGQVFPDYEFVGLDGKAYDLYQNLRGKKSVLIFLTTDCGHCIQVAERWDSAYSRISLDYKVVGISFEPLEKLREFQTAKNVSFPLYNDPQGKFTGKYKFDGYPTLIGLNQKKEIAFIELWNLPKKKVEEYLRLL